MSDSKNLGWLCSATSDLQHTDRMRASVYGVLQRHRGPSSATFSGYHIVRHSRLTLFLVYPLSHTFPILAPRPRTHSSGPMTLTSSTLMLARPSGFELRPKNGMTSHLEVRRLLQALHLPRMATRYPPKEMSSIVMEEETLKRG